MKKNISIYIIILLLSFSWSQEQYTLETCDTFVDVNVPFFFQNYFHCVDIHLSESGDYVNLYYNGLAPYESWYYSSDNPNNIEYSPQGQGYFLINNAYIEEMDYVISIPINPIPRDMNWEINNIYVDGESNTMGEPGFYEYPMGSVGAALNGVNIFNPCASSPDIIEDEAYSFDLYHGHPAGSSGTYHYHTVSPGPLEVLKYKKPNLVNNTVPGSGEIELYGIMCDGTVVMGCKELDGTDIINSNELDAQHGHVHDIVDENGTVMLENRYHTHMCYDELSYNDTNGNGYEQHEFTPEISYYETPGMGETNNRCAAMASPYESDAPLNNKAGNPITYSLGSPYPNPFNPNTMVNFSVPIYDMVNVSIYDMNGKLITVLVNEHMVPGDHSIGWYAKDYPSGVYFIKLKSSNFVSSQKVMLIK